MCFWRLLTQITAKWAFILYPAEIWTQQPYYLFNARKQIKVYSTKKNKHGNVSSITASVRSDQLLFHEQAMRHFVAELLTMLRTKQLPTGDPLTKRAASAKLLLRSSFPSYSNTVHLCLSISIKEESSQMFWIVLKENGV